MGGQAQDNLCLASTPKIGRRALAASSTPIEYLRQRWQIAQARNPNLSLRGYAKKIGIPAPTLSRILSGRRALTLSLAKRIFPKICETPEESRRVLRSYVERRDLSAVQSVKYTKLKRQELEILRQWGHFAVLEYLRVRSPVRDLQHLCAQVALAEDEVLGLLRDLRSIQLARVSPRRGWEAVPTHFSALGWDWTERWKEIHLGHLKKAQRVLESSDYSPQDQPSTFRGVTFWMDPKDHAYAASRIGEFLRDLSDDLAARQEEKMRAEVPKSGAETPSQGELTRVQLQLFPLGVR